MIGFLFLKDEEIRYKIKTLRAIHGSIPFSFPALLKDQNREKAVWWFHKRATGVIAPYECNFEKTTTGWISPFLQYTP